MGGIFLEQLALDIDRKMGQERGPKEGATHGFLVGPEVENKYLDATSFSLP